MDAYVIRQLTEQEIPSAFSLLHSLRPHVDESCFQSIYEKAKAADAYRFIGVWETGALVGLMGVRELYDYVHGRHWYVDDLIIETSQRSKGYGAHLLRWLENEAKTQNILCLRLSTGTKNTAGMKFYEREDWKLRSVTYKKFPLEVAQ